MSTSAATLFPHQAESQVEAGSVQGRATLSPVPGDDSSGENEDLQIHSTRSGPAPDVVKVQLEPPDEIAVYQFVDQQGTLILQVPPQVLLNLARDISQELAAETAAKSAAVEGGKDNGH
ncbi:MAG: hypothetical protein ABSC33_10890 [Candidatus Sulfotelmatobacter sp.]|jgi:hypothetical protein